KYAILVSGADPTLVFSFIGYVSQEIKVKDKSVVNVAMHIDAQLLSEVVVTGYAEMKKHDVTGAVHGVSVRGKARKFSSAPVQQNRTEYEYQDNIRHDWNTEEYDAIHENIFHDAIRNPLSTFSIDVDAAS